MDKRGLDQSHGLTTRDLMKLAGVYHSLKQEGDQNGWNVSEENENLQRNNFRSLLHIERISGHAIRGASCLDVGCGTGDFSTYWRKAGGGRYMGIDPLGFQIDEARRRYPEEAFMGAELLSNPDDAYPISDFTFASGSLTVTTDMESREYLDAMLRKMYHIAERGLAFNLFVIQPESLISNITQRFHEGDVRAICQDLSPRKHDIIMEPVNAEMQLHGYLWR